MTSIEYRLLLAESPDPDGDRWVVGVLHWDGRTFRHAFQPSKPALSRSTCVWSAITIFLLSLFNGKNLQICNHT